MKTAYAVTGMHCASCEVLIEEKLLAEPDVHKVIASGQKGEVIIESAYEIPVKKLNNLFAKEGYVFSVGAGLAPARPSAWPARSERATARVAPTRPILIAGLIFITFLLLNRTGLATLVNLSSTSTLPAFFVFGVLAGISTCATLLSGLILALPNNPTGRFVNRPYIQFYAGRLLTYTAFGAILGLVGQKLQLSPTLGALLVLLVSVMMILQGLKLLGLKVATVTLPKALSRNILRRGPAVMGALTVFLPCGFTITAEGLALLSGRPETAAVMLFLFALGTLPGLMLTRLSLAKLGTQVAGALIVLFAFFNINAQLNVLNLPSLSPVTDIKNQEISQVIKMTANANGYTPNYFKVRVNQPVRWEITDTGTSGCTNAVISRSLFTGQIDLTPGKTSVKEFTPTQTGKFRFSCWMGMVNGVIEVVGS